MPLHCLTLLWCANQEHAIYNDLERKGALTIYS